MRPILAVLFLFGTTFAFSQNKTTQIVIPGVETGESLLRECPELRPNLSFEDTVKVNYCLGVVRGVMDYNKLLHFTLKLNLFCAPKELDNAAAYTVTRQYIREHSDRTKMPASALVAGALSEKYPCPPENATQHH